MKYKKHIAISGLAVIALIAVLFPSFASPRWLHIAIVCFYYIIMAQSWNLLMGYTGLFSFAHPAMAAAGGYVSTILALQLGYPPLLTMIIGGFAAAFLSFILGAISLRLHGFYLCLVTWAYLEIFVNFIKVEHTLTGGTMGLQTAAMFDRSLGRPPFYFLGFTLVVLLTVFMVLLTRSRVGLYLRSIRDDQLASEVMGVNPTKWKVFAFTVAGFWAGMAGSFYVHALRVVDPTMSTMGEVGLIVLMVVIGGISTIAGPIIGTIITVIISQTFSGQFADLSLLLFAVVMIAVMRFFPGGLMSLTQKVSRYLKKIVLTHNVLHNNT